MYLFHIKTWLNLSTIFGKKGYRMWQGGELTSLITRKISFAKFAACKCLEWRQRGVCVYMCVKQKGVWMNHRGTGMDGVSQRACPFHKPTNRVSNDPPGCPLMQVTPSPHAIKKLNTVNLFCFETHTHTNFQLHQQRFCFYAKQNKFILSALCNSGKLQRQQGLSHKFIGRKKNSTYFAPWMSSPQNVWVTRKFRIPYKCHCA